MKLTRKEAQFIVSHLCTQPPVDDALDRALSHEWTFDPRGSKLTALLRSYHEQDQVLYRTWSCSGRRRLVRRGADRAR